MADIVFIAVTLAFFALCVLYVRGLDRLVRSAADADPTGGDGLMDADNVVALVLAVLLAAYLVAALLFPERF